MSMQETYTNADPCRILQRMAQQIISGFAATRSGQVTIAADPAHAIDLLSAGRPGGLAIVLWYAADVAAGADNLPEDTLVTAQISIGVIRARDLAAPVPATPPPALADAASLRTFLAQQAATETLTGCYEYAGMQAMQSHDGELLHGYALSYHILYAYTV